MIHYSTEPRDWIGYGFLSFAKNIGKNIGENKSNCWQNCKSLEKLWIIYSFKWNRKYWAW